MQTAVSKGQVKLESNVDYAVIHNEGGTVTITITPEARKYFWAMYYKTKEERFKAMALSPKNSFKITIPQRQFAPIEGEDLPAMDKFIEDEMDKKMKDIFNS